MNNPEATNTGPRPKASEILRWFAVLPAAAVAAFVGARIIAGVTYALYSPRAGDPQASSYLKVVLTVLNYVPPGAIFVVAGALIAPRLRVAAAYALALCWIGLSLTTHLFTQARWGTTNYTHVALESAGAAIGIAVVLYLIPCYSPSIDLRRSRWW